MYIKGNWDLERATEKPWVIQGLSNQDLLVPSTTTTKTNIPAAADTFTAIVNSILEACGASCFQIATGEARAALCTTVGKGSAAFSLSSYAGNSNSFFHQNAHCETEQNDNEATQQQGFQVGFFLSHHGICLLWASSVPNQSDKGRNIL